MLNNNNGRSLRNKLIKDVKECLRIKGMKADGRFIKDKDCIFLPLPHVAGKFQPLRFTAGKAGRCFFQRQIPQAQVFQDAQFFRALLEPLGSLKGIIEDVMLDVMYDIPKSSEPRKVIITKACIDEGRKPDVVPLDK